MKGTPGDFASAQQTTDHPPIIGEFQKPPASSRLHQFKKGQLHHR